MAKSYFEIFPRFKSSKQQTILHNICFIIQVHIPNKESYLTLEGHLLVQCIKVTQRLKFLENNSSNIPSFTNPLLEQFCRKARSCQSISASHIDQRDLSAFHRPLYKRPDFDDWSCEIIDLTEPLSFGRRLKDL